MDSLEKIDVLSGDFPPKEILLQVDTVGKAEHLKLTLKVLITTIDALGHSLNRIITAQWEGMGDVGSARYKPALL